MILGSQRLDMTERLSTHAPLSPSGLHRGAPSLAVYTLYPYIADEELQVLGTLIFCNGL